MSRMTSMRKQSRKSARRANKKMAPVASDARESAIRYAETTRDWATPKVEAARDWAAPRVEPVATRVKDDVVPKVAAAVTAALAASEPAREEAKTRGTAAIAALRGEVEAPKPKKHRLRKLFLFASVIGAAVAGWKAWAGQQNRQPEPWATPITTAPMTDDAAGASPDEALADAAEEDTVRAEKKAAGTIAGTTGTTASTSKTGTGSSSTVEKVPAKAAKKAKSEGDAGRSSTRKAT